MRIEPALVTRGARIQTRGIRLIEETDGSRYSLHPCLLSLPVREESKFAFRLAMFYKLAADEQIVAGYSIGILHLVRAMSKKIVQPSVGTYIGQMRIFRLHRDPDRGRVLSASLPCTG
jgi:hypothetical protein